MLWRENEKSWHVESHQADKPSRGELGHFTSFLPHSDMKIVFFLMLELSV